LPNFRKAIVQWFKDIAIEEYNYDLNKNQTHYSRIYNLAKSCQNEKEDKDVTSSRIASHLWNAALKGSVPPIWILAAVLKRARLDKRGVTPERAALIKLILNRSNKGGAFMIQEKLMDGTKPIAYVCGQIFAKLESIQYAALGERNAGIREKYFTYAMTLPSAAFGRLFNLNSKHFTKLKGNQPDYADNLDKQLQALCKNINIEDFPQTFSLEQQGQFAIGYYHQKQA
jgi:CRISPR-associated protein Csd1